MPQKQSTVLLWIVAGGGGLVFLIVSLLALIFYFPDEGALSFSSNRVAVLRLEGVISDSVEFSEQLRDFGNRSGVKAVVVRINSPGGGVAASQEIYDEIKKFRSETHKKVVVSMSSVAASGGYYVACAADKIFANPGTITGSIGVIAEWYNYGDLLKWAKMQSVVIKSGPLKDAGSPTRPLTEPEKAYFQSLIDGMYGQFVLAVASSRYMDEARVRELADGRVYTGQEAQAEGLIDEIGTLRDAIAAAGKMGGITGTPRTISPARKRPSLLDLIFGDARSTLALSPDHSQSHIRFEYLWR